MQDKDGDDRDNAVKKGNGRIRHRDAGELGNEEGDDELKGLHLSDLPLSHQPHDDKEHEKDDGRADHDECHTDSFGLARKNMPKMLAVRSGW